MTNYSLTTHTTAVASLGVVAAAIETKLETVNNAKTIRYVDIKPIGNDFQGIIIYDT